MRTLRTLTRVELKLFLREPLTLVFVFAYPVIVLVVLGGFFADVPMESGEFAGMSYLDQYVPAYVGLVIASIGLIGLPVHVAAYREAGVLRRLSASGVSGWIVFGAQASVSGLIATAGSLLLVALGLVAYGVPAPASPVGVLLAFVLGMAAFAALGILLGVALPTARAAQAAGLLLWFVSMFLSGADGPLPAMPLWMQRLAEAVPLTHVVAALQQPWLRGALAATDMLVVLGVAIAAALLARWVLDRERD